MFHIILHHFNTVIFQLRVWPMWTERDKEAELGSHFSTVVRAKATSWWTDTPPDVSWRRLLRSKQYSCQYWRHSSHFGDVIVLCCYCCRKAMLATLVVAAQLLILQTARASVYDDRHGKLQITIALLTRSIRSRSLWHFLWIYSCAYTAEEK